MATEITIEQGTNPWDGKRLPLGSTYGKMMMWFFLLSDAFTFSAFLTAYGFFRFSSTTWPNPEVVFQSVPFVTDYGLPLVFVGIMTFILIASSLTMVLAVEAGHRRDNSAVAKYMVYTVIGGAMFLGCQALEWNHLLHQGLHIGISYNDFLPNQEIEDGNHHAESHVQQMIHNGEIAKDDVERIEAEKQAYAKHWLAERRIFYPVNLVENGTEKAIIDYPVGELKIVDKPVLDYNGIAFKDKEGNFIDPEGKTAIVPSGQTTMFGKLFFFITGFHGFHVFTGVLLLVIIMINVFKGTYIRRGYYEMVEKVGLYWHFVDLVWVFVFTLFYLI